MIRRLILLTFIVILTTAFRATPVHGPGLTVVGRPAAGLPPAQEAPSGRLAQAQEAFAAGDDETARSRFEAILADPAATPDEQRLALYWRGRSELEGGDAAAAVATLDQFLQQYPGDALARAAQFNLGRAHQAAGQFDAASAAYRATLLPDDPTNVYIHRQIGDAAMAGNLSADAVAAYQAGLDATEDDALKIQMRERLAEAELAGGNPAGAIAQYETLLTTLEDTFQRAKYLRLMGEAYLAANDPAAGHDRYLEAVNRYPAAKDSHLALIELVNAGVPVDEFQRGLVNYYAEAYQPAVDAFRRYLDQTPAPVNADVALWRMGQAFEELKAYDSAITTFQELIANYPDSDHWGEAQFELGQALIGQGDYDRAKTVFRDFAAAYPASGLAPQALWRPARLEFDQHDLAEARTHFLAMAAAYPASDLAVDSLYWAGHAAYRLPDYEAALADWQQLIDTYPASDLVLFAQYWQGKALLALGRTDEAQALLTEVSDGPLDYYRLRARVQLDNQPPVAVPLTIPTADQLAAEQAEAEAWLRSWFSIAETGSITFPGEAVQADPAFRRGDTLLAFGLREEALAEFETVKDNWWHNALAMYQLSNYFHEHQIGLLSIVSAARVIFLSPAAAPEEAPLYIQRLYYPIFFDEVVLAEAQRRDLDPALVIALIRQESLFEQSAESYVGAQGLMQVMPATGEEISAQSDLGSYGAGQLWRPYVNIKFGSWYLKEQLNAFNGNSFAALAAYNAGPDRVAEWIQVSDDLDVFTEAVPFFESRTYIRRIYENLAAYRRVYGPPAGG